MNIIYQSAEFLTSFIEIFLLYNVYRILFQKNRRFYVKWIDLLVAFIGTILMQVCNATEIFSYFTMILFVLYTSITAKILYKIGYVVIFSLSCFYLLCVGCIDFLTFTLISNFFGGYNVFITMISTPSIIRMITILSIKLFWIVLYFAFRKQLYKISLNRKKVYTFLVIAILGFLGFTYLVDQTFLAFGNHISGIWLMFVLFFAMGFFVIYFIFKSKEEKMNLNFVLMRNNLLEENYNNLSEIYQRNAKLYHDLNNHLNVLYQLIDQGNVIDAKDYIKEISKPITQLSKIVWTGIDVVDVIINSKLEKMRELDINVRINVEFPQNTNIKAQDICTILSNLLDNAIEAAMKVNDETFIEIVMRKINHFILIRISNSTQEHAGYFIDYPETSKENKELHGWGLSNVKDAVEKYNGSMKCIDEQGKFIVTTMLFYDKK